MKKIFILFSLIFCLLATQESHAQNWNEWFRQKKTQRRYLVKQIALLQVYLGYVKKGYRIVDKGLTTIHNIKNGDFNLHRDFFSSLKNVNPHISNSAKVADIIAFQVFIINDLKRTTRFCKTNKHFTPEEIRHVAAIYTNMLKLSDANISELLTIIRSNQTEMKDDERIDRIDKLYEDMLDKHAFVKSFNNDVHVIAQERERENNSIESIKKQYDLI